MLHVPIGPATGWSALAALALCLGHVFHCGLAETRVSCYDRFYDRETKAAVEPEEYKREDDDYNYDIFTVSKYRRSR